MSEGFGRMNALALLEEWTKGESLRKHGHGSVGMYRVVRRDGGLAAGARR